MGSFSDAMQRLADNIISSAESRRVKISEIKSDNHNSLERFSLERQDMAKELKDAAEALKEKLSSDNTANEKATQQFITSVRADIQNMAETLEEKLSSGNTANKKATQQFITSVRADIQNMAETIKERLSSDNTANKKATQQFITELASDRGTAQRIWGESFGGMVEKLTQLVVEEVVIEEPVQPVVEEIAVEEPTPPSAEKEAEPFSEKQVLDVIAGYSEGIKLVDIGNELGIDWRALIGIVKPLVDDGRIDKIDNLYYPKN